MISGEADLCTAESLREDLGRALTPTTRSVTIDVSRLRFCDLAGLDALDGFCMEAEARDLSLTVHGMSPLLARLHDMFSSVPGL